MLYAGNYITLLLGNYCIGFYRKMSVDTTGCITRYLHYITLSLSAALYTAEIQLDHVISDAWQK